MKKCTRSEARNLGLKRYFTNKLCKQGHMSERYVSSGNCLRCLQVRDRHPVNIEKRRAYQRERMQDPKLRPMLLKNMQKYNQTKTAKQSMKRWREQNLDKRAAIQALYRTKKLQATPKWLTSKHIKKMEDFYIAATKQKLTVDHIVPIKGKNVCGLHVPWNLQLLSHSENSSKGNRW